MVNTSIGTFFCLATSMLDFTKTSSAPLLEKQQSLCTDALQKTASSKATGQHAQSLLSSVAREDTLKAEILWFLKLIDCHWSFSST